MGLEVEENFFLNVDLTDDTSASVIMVFRQCGSSVKMVNSFTGEDATRFYKILCGEEKLA